MKALLLSALFICYLSTILKAETEINIKVYTKKVGNGYNVYIDNKEYCPVSIQLNFELTNLETTVKKDNTIVVPARNFEYLLASLKPTVSVGKIALNYNFKCNYGDVTLKYFDSDFVYELPYANQEKFRIGQGYFGKSTHKGINALDFNMPLKTPIHAARAGTVVKVVDFNSKNCFNASCAKFNNYILIYHEDGTFSQYAHIAKNGSKVKTGDFVQAGQLVCLSGNTGYSSGPHLHFAVYLPRWEDPEYVPTYFKTKKQTYTILEEGKTYKRK